MPKDNEKSKVVQRFEKGPNGQLIKVTERIIEKSDDDKKEKVTKTPKVEEISKTSTNVSNENNTKSMIDIITSKKFIIIVGVLIVSIIILLLVLSAISKPKTDYTIEKVVVGNIYSSVEGEGTLQSSAITQILSKVSSTVTKVNYKKGQEIKEGDLLIEFDTQYANSTVKQYESAITTVKKMQEAFNLQKDDLVIKASNYGFLRDMKNTQDINVNVGDLIGYLIPTTTFMAQYNVTYSTEKKIQLWQQVKATYSGGTVEGVIYNITGDLIEGSTVKIDVYVADSKVNLSNESTSAEIVTPTGSIFSNGSTNFLGVTPIGIYAKQSGTIKGAQNLNNKLVKKDETICTIVNEGINKKIFDIDNKLLELQKNSDFQKFDLNNYKVYSTIDGTIDSEPVVLGQNVMPNIQLITVKTANKINCEIKITKEELEKIQLGQEVIITTVVNNQTKTINGKVIDKEVPSITDVDTKYKVTITINKEQADLSLIDKNAKAEIILEKKEGTLMVPTKAVYLEANNYYVDTDNGEKKVVTIGLMNSTNCEILEGLKEGDSVKVYNNR